MAISIKIMPTITGEAAKRLIEKLCAPMKEIQYLHAERGAWKRGSDENQLVFLRYINGSRNSDRYVTAQSSLIILD